jgi:hypothetical protein
VVEIKSFPILDGGADPAKVGAAARQAAVYVLALRATAAELAGSTAADPGADRFNPYLEPEGLAGAPTGTALLVCPKDFSNLPTAAAIDVRKPMAVTHRQLERLTRIEQLLDALPPGTDFVLDESRSEQQLTASVAGMDAAYSPDCLSTCELAFHCRDEARCAGSVEVLGRGVRGELGSVGTVAEALAASEDAASGDETAARLAHAAALRAEALATAGAGAGPGAAAGVRG